MNMGMGSGGGSSGMMRAMPMVFTTGESTPLYSTAWTPSSVSSYAGTCIFLIVVAVIARLLLLGRQQLEITWRDRHAHPKRILSPEKSIADEQQSNDGSSTEADQEGVLPARDADQRVRILLHGRGNGSKTIPWRFSVDLPRACLFTVQVGVSYLL